MYRSQNTLNFTVKHIYTEAAVEYVIVVGSFSTLLLRISFGPITHFAHQKLDHSLTSHTMVTWDGWSFTFMCIQIRKVQEKKQRDRVKSSFVS